jgi:hypothetical protein
MQAFMEVIPYGMLQKSKELKPASFFWPGSDTGEKGQSIYKSMTVQSLIRLG